MAALPVEPERQQRLAEIPQVRGQNAGGCGTSLEKCLNRVLHGVPPAGAGAKDAARQEAVGVLRVMLLI